MRFATRCIHADQRPDPTTGAIATPVFQTSTYVQEWPARHKGYEYSRTGNPTRAALEDCIADLEGAGFARCFSSGMGAIDTVLKLLSAGHHVVAGNDLYGGTYRIFTQVFRRLGLDFTFVDTTDLAQVEMALRPNTKMIWVETPSNPLLRISDLKAIGAIARGVGPDCLFVVDNTFASPALQRPFEADAQVVIHSTTKYLGGHADVVGGAAVSVDPEVDERIGYLQNACGAVPGPLDCFLVLRGVKTLPLRMARHCENAARVAAWLQEQPKVARVHYPGLPSHPNHAVAKEQMKGGFGGMVSFELSASVEDAMAACAKTKVFKLAESLGGVESLIEHPPSMTHAAVPAPERRAAGLADGLIRLSVGIEDKDDLIEDLAQAIGA